MLAIIELLVFNVYVSVHPTRLLRQKTSFFLVLLINLTSIQKKAFPPALVTTLNYVNFDKKFFFLKLYTDP